MKKRILCLVLFVLLLIPPLTAHAQAAASSEPIASGDYYPIKWSLDRSGTLTIDSHYGGAAFPNFRSDRRPPWYNCRSQIKKVVITDTQMPAIGDYAFADCTALREVSIASRYLKTIGTYAFSGCSNLPFIALPTSFFAHKLQIGDYAFYGCSRLQSIALPYNTYLGKHAFVGCGKLSAIHLDCGSTNRLSYAGTDSAGFGGTDNCLPVGGDITLYFAPGVTVDATLSAKKFGAYRVQWLSASNGYCGNTIRWSFDDTTGTLTLTGSGSTWSYSSGSQTPWAGVKTKIKSVVIGSGITRLEAYLFEYCTAVSAVTLPDTLTVLACNAFNDCESLEHLLIPQSVKSFSGYFNRCTRLTDLYYLGSAEQWAQIPNHANAAQQKTLHTLTARGTPPTCTEAGARTHYVFENTSVYTGRYDALGKPITGDTTLPPLGHTVVIDAAIAPTCTTAGLSEGSHCAVCSAVLTAQKVIRPTGHTRASLPAVPPSCTSTGLTEGEHCSVCLTVFTAQNTVAPLPHTPAVDAAVAPTCTETGLSEGSHCAVCLTVLVPQNVLPTAPHTVVTDPAIPPTCTAAGTSEGNWCAACEAFLGGYTPLPPLGHNETVTPAVAAACTAPGLTEGKHCSRCSLILLAQSPTAPLGHAFAEDGACLHGCGTVCLPTQLSAVVCSQTTPTACTFSVTIRSSDTPCGTLIVAVYDARGRCIGLTQMPIALQPGTEKIHQLTVTGEITVADTPHTCSVFLLDSTGFFPMTESISISVQ